MKKKLFFGLAISAFCLFLVFREINLAELQKSLARVKYSYLLITLGCLFLFSFLRALRWKYLIAPLKKVKTRNLFELVMIGFLANNILPARIGEVARAFILGKAEGISKISSLATIVMERIFDLLTLIVVLLIGSHYLPYIRQKNHLVLLLAGGSFGLLFLLLLVVKYRKGWVIYTTNKILSPLSPHLALQVEKSMQAFFEGLKVLEGGGHLVKILALSLMIGLSMAGVYFFVALAFDIHLSLLALLVLISAICLGMVIPSSPGFIGTFHYFCIQGLFLVGIRDKNLALSYAIIAHLIQYIPESLLGIIFFWKMGLSFQEIKTTDELNF